ncbi:unnamed protein product [Cylicostephanus goldi]|uniref:Uncharacterized protein n=1 Tax=Cylicostephanus goldi TaxID=71465 RepID=A0A3P6SYV1_CYLGO|nr:unnamed protein product [Cylicostephanus goldi]
MAPAAMAPAVPPSPPAAPASSTRKTTNGKKEPPADGEKPKRGRPRKIKRSEKCLDEELCEEVTNGIEKDHLGVPEKSALFFCHNHSLVLFGSHRSLEFEILFLGAFD